MKRKERLQMTEGPILRQLFFFALPLMASNVLQQLYNTVDAIIVGNCVGAKALAAVGSSGLLVIFMIYFFLGLSIGSSIVISQAYGGGNQGRVHRAVHTTAGLSLISGLALMIIGILFAPYFLRWMNVPDDAMNMAVTYIKIYFLGMIPMMVYNMGSGILRAIGDTKTALYGLGAASVLNILLDLLFVAGLSMGVAGAAAASALSQLVAAMVVVIRLIREKDIYGLSLTKIHIYKDELRSIVRIGMPTGLQSVLVCFSNIIVQSRINIFGLGVMAGYTSYMKVDGFLFTTIDAYSMAVSNFVGQNIGAGKYDRVRKSMKVCAGLCVCTVFVLGGLILLNADPILRLFTGEPQVAHYGKMLMFTMIPFYWIFGINQSFSGVIRGAGEAAAPMWISLISMCGLRITWIIGMLSVWKDVRIIYVSYPLTWIVTFFVFLLYYHKGKWLKKYTGPKDKVYQ